MNTKIKQNKGITLISLVVTIIILIILAGITLNMLFREDGILKRAKETKPIQDVATAQEQLELLKAPIKLDGKTINLTNYLEKLEKEKDKYKASDIEEVNEKNATVLIDDKYKFLITDKENGDVEIIYQGEASKLVLSETSGTFTYPETGEFSIIQNESGGELTVESENENIATAEINGETVTVKSQTVSGTVKIIVRSAANNGFAAGKATYTATVENGTIEIEATPYQGTYDGQPHDALTSVSTNPTGTTLRYSLNGGEFSDKMPQITDVGIYTIAVEASKKGYATKTQTITTPAEIGQQGNTEGNLTLSATSGTITYPTAGTFTVTKNVSGGELSVSPTETDAVKVSISGTTVTVTPKVITTNGQKVTITVKSAAKGNYGEQTATYEATVNQGIIEIDATTYRGTYDGQAHNALTSVSTTPTGTTLEYSLNGGAFSDKMPQITDAGVYTIAVRASKEGYVTKTQTITTQPKIDKSNTATASAKTGLIYNGSAQTGVTGSNVTWTGTTSATNAGTYTAYATPNSNYAWSDGTTTKKEIPWTIGQKAISNCTVTLGTTIYTYNGTAKTPTVTVTDGSKTLTNGTDYTVTYSNNINVGTATVTITGTGNYTGTTFKTFTINAQLVTGITLNKTATTIIKGKTETLTATISPTYANNKGLTWSSSNTSVATVSGGTVTAISAGTATITATTQDGSGKSASCVVTVENEKLYLIKNGMEQVSFSQYRISTVENTFDMDNSYITVKTKSTDYQAHYYTTDKIDFSSYSKICIDFELLSITTTEGVTAVSLAYYEDGVKDGERVEIDRVRLGGQDANIGVRMEHTLDIKDITTSHRISVRKNMAYPSSNAKFNIYALWLEK